MMNQAPAKSRVAEPLLPAAWKIPQEFRDRLGDDVGRQRKMEADGHLLLVLHSPPKPTEDVRHGRLFWRDADGRWKPQPLKHDDHAVGELLAEYESRADELDNAHDDASCADDAFALLSALNPLVRTAHNLYEVLQDARKAVKADRKLILLRDRAYAVTRRLELMQQDARNTLDFVVARRSEQQADAAAHQSQAAHRLNVLAALFFPLATLTAIFGMDLGHGLEAIDTAHAPLPMLAVLGGGLVLGASLAAFVTRK
ncbi:MAG: hypothetical protein AAFV43_03045 [Planctomycetota bacterium]